MQPRTFLGRHGPLHVPIARHAPRRDHPPLRPPSTAPRRDPAAGTAREEGPAPAPGGEGERAGGGGELQRRRGRGVRRHCCACAVEWSGAQRDAGDAMGDDQFARRRKIEGALKISPRLPLPCRRATLQVCVKCPWLGETVRGRARVVPLVCGPTSGPGTPVGARGSCAVG